MQKSTQLRHRFISNSGNNSLPNSKVSSLSKNFESKLFVTNREELKFNSNLTKEYSKTDNPNTKKL